MFSKESEMEVKVGKKRLSLREFLLLKRIPDPGVAELIVEVFFVNPGCPLGEEEIRAYFDKVRPGCVRPRPEQIEPSLRALIGVGVLHSTDSAEGVRLTPSVNFLTRVLAGKRERGSISFNGVAFRLGLLVYKAGNLGLTGRELKEAAREVLAITGAQCDEGLTKLRKAEMVSTESVEYPEDGTRGGRVGIRIKRTQKLEDLLENHGFGDSPEGIRASIKNKLTVLTNARSKLQAGKILLSQKEARFLISVVTMFENDSRISLGE